ncbi:MAG TPA: gluconate 2-dehydrogenase subunit 3 family protein [Xanthobacteraceae bacterium]|nr:gluconate 2-dehydrogenase subunit 3 family protein [Xanthobacteraceae bacterium]
MSRHDETRRTFLKGAAVGASAIAGAGLAGASATQAFAKEKEKEHQHKTAAAESTDTPAHQRASGEGHGAFFNDEDAATVLAFAERLMPGAPGMPGARDADVLNYIDLALAGAYEDQQDFYRRGLAQLEAFCQNNYKTSFVRLDAARQDAVISALEEGKAQGFTYPTAQAFFNTLRTHTIEGMFSDPVYGGNRDFAGWRLVGFPGAQTLFTTADMQSKDAFTRAPITGLQGQAKPDAKAASKRI